jgi:hypothetical protein
MNDEALQNRATKIIQPLVPPDAEKRVNRSYKQWNQIIRDHIRTETGLKLSDGVGRYITPFAPRDRGAHRSLVGVEGTGQKGQRSPRMLELPIPLIDRLSGIERRRSARLWIWSADLLIDSTLQTKQGEIFLRKLSIGMLDA